MDYLKLITLERFITKHLLIIHMMTLSLLLGNNTVHIELTDGQEIQGEFIGTYMNHVHILTEKKTYYYACDDILSIASSIKGFDYDCSKNTVTADILFPPELDPMTGEWAQRLPDVFSQDIAKPVIKKETDGVDQDSPTINLGEVIQRFEKEVSTLDKKDVTEKGFIMINGVKYVRSASDKETKKDIIQIATIEEVVFQAQKAAQQMERKTLNQFLGAGYCTLLGVLGLPASILHVEFLANSKMDSDNPFYMNLDPSLKVVYEKSYKKEEKRLRRKTVYGTQRGCILMLIGWVFLAVSTDS